MNNQDKKVDLSSLTRFGFDAFGAEFVQIENGPFVRLADVEALLGGESFAAEQSHKIRGTRAVEAIQKLSQTSGNSHSLRNAIDAVACITTTEADFGIYVPAIKLARDNALHVLQTEFIHAITKEGKSFTDELDAANVEVWGLMHPDQRLVNPADIPALGGSKP